MTDLVRDHEGAPGATGGHAAHPVPPSSVDDPHNLLHRTVSDRAAPTVESAIEAAIALLEEHGEQDFRIADVRERTGISVGSLYHHFGSRDGLIKAARAHQFYASFPRDGQAMRAIAERASSAAEFLEGLRSVIHDVQSSERSPNRMRRIEFMGSSISRPDLLDTLRAVQTEIMNEGMEFAQYLIDRGWVREGISARSLVSFTFALTLGRVVLDLDELAPDAAEWERTVQLATAGLFRIEGGS